MTADHVRDCGGRLLGVVASMGRCVMDLCIGTGCAFRRGCAGLAAAGDSMLCCLRQAQARPSVGSWDIDGGLQGPALRRSEMGEWFAPLVSENDWGAL
uniref:Uncharacterized protein n=2 Tax=Physcomitrium patens TaxID=3218 RepID=A0A2K1KQR7_PHYPA|nr:uncharacterized protein LOC112281156 isoform X2 [Physcomitrium patens]XP_024373143.1 uncharacterized protein LOC112281156 isoform X2 [Physcomitrium patens]PNR56101.1 hypothetical protein PHYPA_006998 [Physcomitrium patens]|eukprot:XP_024373142.1 uncharacterized protein LOC112281156 isoform X2 [Physcomitrella patens]